MLNDLFVHMKNLLFIFRILMKKIEVEQKKQCLAFI